jgi:hypothetical protein
VHAMPLPDAAALPPVLAVLLTIFQPHLSALSPLFSTTSSQIV